MQKKALYSSETRLVIDMGQGWEHSLDGERWQSVNVPFSQDVDEPIYFEKTIKLKESAARKYIWALEFLGLTEEVEISVNGNFIEKFFGGGGKFSVNIPEKFLDRPVNTFRFKVYPPSNQTRLALGSNIYAPEILTGINRNIFLVGRPKIWINEFNYRTTLANNYSSAKLDLDVSISSKEGDYLTDLNISESTRASIPDTLSSDQSDSLPYPKPTHAATTVVLSATLYDMEGREVGGMQGMEITIDPDRTIRKKIGIEVLNPHLWDPRKPELYTLKLALRVSADAEPIDEISENIGFRDISISEKGFVLNGVPFLPKGVNYTPPFPKDSIMVPELLEEDVNRIKSLGANLILLNKTIPHPYLAYLCDRYGLFMMVDLPVDAVPSGMIEEDNFRVRTLNIAERLVDGLENRVSLLAWGLHGNISTDSEGISFSGLLHQRLSSLTDKLLYVTTSGHSYIPEGIDFLTMRIPASERNFEKVAATVTAANDKYNLPLLIRYGVAVQTQYLYGWEDPQSEEYQGHYLKNIYSIINRFSGMGSIVDYYRDYRLENPLLTVNKEDLYLATAGLISDEGQEKIAYRVMKAFYNDEKQPLISAGEPKSDAPVIFTIISIVLVLIVLLMLNRYRKFREYFTRSLIRPYNFYSDIRDQRIMSTARTFIIGFVVASSMALFISAIIYNYKTTETLQTVLMLFIPLDSALDFLFRISWQPLLMFVFFTSLFFLLMFLISFFLKFFSIFSRNRILFSDTLTITIWAAIPFLIMLPISMILPRLLTIGEAAVIAISILGLVLALWIFLRILNSTAVVFDKALPNVYVIGLMVLIVLLLIPTLVYQSNYNFLDYLEYFALSQTG